MNQMNKEQADAVRHLSGPCVVIAPPGSGKTFVLTNRIQYLVTEAGISPSKILVITFTKAAALEMQSRYQKLDPAHGAQISFGTFHSIFYTILRKSGKLNGCQIVSEHDKVKLLDRLLLSLRKEEEELPDPSTVLNEISKMKNLGLNPETFHTNQMDDALFHLLAARYLTAMQNRHLIDYDDMILQCYFLLKNETQVRDYWQNQYHYILIDEFQDINPLQFEIVTMLAAPRNHLFMVGDDDQSIYGFRGASPGVMLSLSKTFPLLNTICLKINYRSCRKIVSISSMLIAKNQKRFLKEMLANTMDTGQVSLALYTSTNAQDDSIIRYLKEGDRYKDAAIIVRTRSALRYYAYLLEANGIQYYANEGVHSPFRNEAVQDVLAYLKCGYGVGQPLDFIRIMNKPERGIARAWLQAEAYQSPMQMLEALLSLCETRRSARNQLLRLKEELRLLRSLPVFAAIHFVRQGMGYEAYLKAKYAGGPLEEKLSEAMQALNCMQELAKQMEHTKKRDRCLAGGETAFMQFYASLEAQMEEGNPKEHTQAGVAIMTMHGSKGLEFDHVILPDLNEGVIPSRKMLHEEGIEEERRLLYVAMTRAKKSLYLCAIHGEDGHGKVVSRFVEEIRALC